MTADAAPLTPAPRPPLTAAPGPLAGFRVLDLTDERGVLAGKVLGDLGADVLRVEPPGGHPMRSRGPFAGDLPGPDRSLFWLFTNTSKRGVTLNLDTRDGRALFRRLAASADFVLESGPPGEMARRGLGYDDLAAVNPRLILTSITPFGQSGPYAGHAADDLTVWAMGGEMYVTGDPSRPPVAIGWPQAYFHGGAEGAAASLIAHWEREASGQGQHVDVSIQQTVVWTLMDATGYWALNRIDRQRDGSRSKAPAGYIQRRLWECKDGVVVFPLMGGNPARAQAFKLLAAWMEREGMGDPVVSGKNWMDDYDRTKLTQADVDAVEEPVARFFATRTKAELWQASLDYRLMLAPVADARDIAESIQLDARGFWTEVEHPELGGPVRYPGALLQMSRTPVGLRRPPPRVGEHNLEIYEGELGLTRPQLVALKGAGVI